MGLMNFDNLNESAIAAVTRGELEEAASFYMRAIEREPNCHEAYNNLAVVLWWQVLKLKKKAIAPLDKDERASLCCNRLNKAFAYLSKAIELKPDYAEAYNNLGLVLQESKSNKEAEIYFRRAIDINAHYFQALNNLGLLLKEEDRFDEAETCLRAALELHPDFPEALNNLGMVLKRRFANPESESAFRRALALKPDYADAHLNLGMFLVDNNRIAEAESCLKETVKLFPDFTGAKFVLGALYLLMGNFNEGWPRYELRYALFDIKRPGIRPWQGESLSGKNLLLFWEPGFGDTIQFIRFAKEAAGLAKKTTVWVQHQLLKLTAGLSNDFQIYSGEVQPEGEYDFACSIPDLAAVFKANPSNIPCCMPYIHASEDIIRNWRENISAIDTYNKLKVGVVWAGNPNHKNDYARSIPFDVFKELFTVNVVWVSLQEGKRAADLAGADLNVINYSDKLTDFAETAGLIENLDLVIAVDTAVAHLAGALNKPTWILLPFVPDWRWLLEREDSPWYPSMRLFRQNKRGDWREVIARVRSELSSYCKKP